MALEKQIVPMPLAKGLDLGTADNLRDPDSLSSGINCEQLITGEIVKRQGFASLATPTSQPITAFPLSGSLGVVEQSADMSTNMQIITRGNLVNSVYRLGLVSPRPVNVTASLIDLLGLSVDIENYDMDWGGSSLVVAITLSGGTTVRSYEFDSLLNLIPAQFGPYNELTGLTGASVKVVGSQIFIYQTGVNTVRLYNNALTYQSVSYSLGGSLSWDVCTWSSGYVIGYDTGANITVTITATATTTTFSNTNVTRVCVFLQGTVFVPTGVIAMVARSTGNKVTAFRYNTSLVLQGTADQGFGGNTVYNITGIAPAGISNILFAVEGGTATASDVEGRFISYYFVSSTYTGTVTLSNYGNNTKRAGLASKPFQFSTGLYPHILLSYEGTDTYGLQNSYFLMQFSVPNGQAGFTAKIGSSKAPQLLSRFTYGANVLPNFAALSATQGIAPILARSDNASTTTVANSVFGLSSCFINLDTYYQGSKPVEIGGYTVIASNQIYLADATGINEINFLLYPDPVVSVSISAGSVPPGDYSYVVVYEAYDNKGNLIESSPSEPFLYNHSGGTHTFTINLNDAGFISRTDVRVSLYRTVDAGTIYYLVGSNSNFTSSTLSISDNLTDDVLQTKKLLYTTGGVVENINPPNSNWIGAAKNRLWTFETGSTDTLWFSKESRDGFIPQFSDLLTINVGRSYGALVGTAALDDKVLVFKEFCVMVIVGDGPSENLIGGWSSPAVIFQGMGCISARSITETPQGVFFQSQEGIYLVDKGMGVSFVGRPLYKSEGTLISSAYNPVNNCVYFLSPTKLWAFYINTGSWYEWTVTNPVDILYESGVLYLITTTKILKQTAGTWQDDASNYQQLIKLGQFQFAGIQGYQRVYKILATGRSLADEAGTVTVKNYFDANTTATDTQTIAQTALVSGNKMSLEIRPSKQKCETMQIELSHTANNSGITINAVTAEVGAIPGAGRRASTGRAV
tara:strand:+ start:4554 stop:7469 length:2916 start_codon:yes stop_codon:yes gene_type:complete